MGIFTTTPVKKTLSEEVSSIVESRKSLVSMFEAVKEGLEDDNKVNTGLQDSVREQIALLEGNLATLKITEENNRETIKELTKFIK